MTKSYKLRNGYSVETRARDEGYTEFTTTDPAGDVVSVVVLGGEAAQEVFAGLRVSTCLRARA